MLRFLFVNGQTLRDEKRAAVQRRRFSGSGAISDDWTNYPKLGEVRLARDSCRPGGSLRTPPQRSAQVWPQERPRSMPVGSPN